MTTRTGPLLRAEGRTDVGRQRDHNEDALLVGPALCVVADGLGGHQGGEVASRLAVEHLGGLGPEPTLDELREALLSAHDIIIDRAETDERLDRMGTTVVMLALSATGPLVLSVGDSRVYLLDGGTFSQVTRDDSLVQDLVDSGTLTAEEARTDPRRHVITQALGLTRDVEVQAVALPPDRPLRVLLCSDGLTEHVADDLLAEVLTAVPDPGAAAEDLVELALEGGGSDNVTVVVADVVPGG